MNDYIGDERVAADECFYCGEKVDFGLGNHGLVSGSAFHLTCQYAFEKDQAWIDVVQAVHKFGALTVMAWISADQSE
jgi:hypothetical protein